MQLYMKKSVRTYNVKKLNLRYGVVYFTFTYLSVRCVRDHLNPALVVQQRRKHDVQSWFLSWEQAGQNTLEIRRDISNDSVQLIIYEFL